MKTDNLRFITKGNEKEGMDCLIGRTESSYWLTGNSENDCLLDSFFLIPVEFSDSVSTFNRSTLKAFTIKIYSFTSIRRGLTKF